MSFQVLDVLTAAVIIASTVYAAYRGFANETLSILAWVAAAVATLVLGPWVAAMLKQAISPSWLGVVVGYFAVFMTVFIPLSFMSFRLSQNIKKSQVGALDRALGAAFGIVRGLAFLGVLYLVFAAIVPAQARPGWVTRAYSLPLVKTSAEVLGSLIPGGGSGEASAPPATENKVTETKAEKASDRAAPAATAPAHKPHAQKPAQKHQKKTKKPKKPTKPAKTYGAKDRKALDKIIEKTNQDGKNGKP